MTSVWCSYTGCFKSACRSNKLNFKADLCLCQPHPRPLSEAWFLLGNEVSLFKEEMLGCIDSIPNVNICWIPLSSMSLKSLEFWTCGPTKQDISFSKPKTHAHTNTHAPFFGAKLICTTVHWSVWPTCSIIVSFLQSRSQTIHSHAFHCEEWKAQQWSFSRCLSFLKGASCSHWPAVQWFSHTASSSLHWGSTDPKKVGHNLLDSPFYPSLQRVNIILPRKPQPSLCMILLKHFRSSEGWQKAGKKGRCFPPTYQGTCFVYLCGLITP